MNTNDVINKLVDHLEPVNPIKPWAWFVGWIIFGVMALALLLQITGVRPDLLDKTEQWWFAAESLLIIILSLSCAQIVLKLGIPGNKPKTFLRRIPVMALMAWLAGSVIRMGGQALDVGAMALVPDAHAACAFFLWGVGAVVALPLFLFLRRAAPVHTSTAGALAVLSGAAFAAAGVQLFCQHETPAHIIAWHILPIVISMPLGLWIAKFIFSDQWEKSSLI